jgi:Flp pilus assembly pilin Flp
MWGPQQIRRVGTTLRAVCSEKGTAIVEYAGMLAGIAILVIASLIFLGGAAGGSFTDVVINTPLAKADYAINPHACKLGGWQTMTEEDGAAFPNQGQCISYAIHHNQ